MATRGKSPAPRRRRRPPRADAAGGGARARGAAATLGAVWRLARPQFLVYSAVCHLLGALAARAQGAPLDAATLAWLQACVWLVHVTAHFVNEWADVESDAGQWTGGSQVLVRGELPRGAALALGAASGAGAVACGAATVCRFVLVRHAHAVDWRSAASVRAALALAPWPFVALGVSVFAIALAYSLPPFRLSGNALGECCVAYVLSFCVPTVGLLAQAGRVTPAYVELLLPFIVVSFARMVVMNIGDRAADAAAGKRTSVVWLGETRAVLLVDALHFATYVCILPQLASLSFVVRLGHYAPLPLRWWQSIRLNSPDWWRDPGLVRSIPFVESMCVLCHALCLCVALQVEHAGAR